MKTIRIEVKGRVQGVFFRQRTLEMAERLGITGYVRNEPDGSVQIVATGNQLELDSLEEWCWKGPDRARVSSVEVTETGFIPFSAFVIRRGEG